MMTSIVILCMNQLQFTKLCVDSILALTDSPYELIFVDNGSSDGTPDWLRAVPGATVIANDKNRGFAGGCNQGMRVARGDSILLLNNDVIVTEGWLSRLVASLLSGPRVGLAGPMTNYISGPQKVEGAAYPDFGEGLQAYAREFARLHAGRRIPVKRLVGFALLFRREVMERVGFLDEKFGGCGSFEDDDYCLRAHEAGYELVVAGDCFIHHFGHITLDDPANNLDRQGQSRINSKIFQEKWGAEKIAREGLTIYAPKE